MQAGGLVPPDADLEALEQDWMATQSAAQDAAEARAEANAISRTAA
jgi:hypothetical protein